jgi:hypothetical protein
MLDVIRKHFTAEESKALDSLHDRGFTQDQFVREAQGKVGTSLIAHGWGKVIHWGSIPFSAVETYNRRSAGLAMFRTARKQGLSYEESLKKAEDFIYNTHYLMGKANMPLGVTGKGLVPAAFRTALTFRMYNYNYLRQMITAARKNPEGKRQWNTIGRSLAYIALFGGVLSWPWIDDILDILERITGNPYRLNLKKMLKRRAGEAGSLIALHGLPGLVNVDLSGSLKMGLPPIPGVGSGLATDISGVYSGMAKKAGQSVHSLATGQPLRALEQAAPAAIENPLKGLRGYAEGMTSNWGKTMYGAKGEPLRLTGWEALKQGAGYRSARMADEAMQKRVSNNIKSYFDGERKGIYEKYRIADRKQDQAAMKRLDSKIDRFNSRVEKYGGVIPLITEESLVGTLEEHPDKRITVD